MTKIIELDQKTVDEIEKATKVPFIYALANPDALDGKVVLLVPPNAKVDKNPTKVPPFTPDETITTLNPNLSAEVTATTCKWVKIGGDLYYICK